MTDAGLRQLKKMSRLKILVLSGETVTDAGIEELQRVRPEMTIVAPDRRAVRTSDSMPAMQLGVPSPKRVNPAGPDGLQTSKSNNRYGAPADPFP